MHLIRFSCVLALTAHQLSAQADSGARVEWRPLLLQSGLFLGIQHSVRFATQEGTRARLKGAAVRDYLRSVRGLPGWHDHDSVLANYVGHPMQGAVYHYLWAANHPAERRLEFSASRAYWRARLKGTLWALASSTQYELGPLGEAAWGNVGLDPRTKGWVDMVTTPTLGLDRHGGPAGRRGRPAAGARPSEPLGAAGHPLLAQPHAFDDESPAAARALASR